ncbi:hypothetical protein [Campylobacter volucris]|uniref:hypothetical protein n=1 Tax=Campylobacter volucris TaxID=1031542 RepID=UPI00164FE191|nr:hypothetical protein [Campylobacter volucris]
MKKIKHNNNIEIIFIEDDKQSLNIYTRKRVKFKTNVEEIHKKDKKLISFLKISKNKTL